MRDRLVLFAVVVLVLGTIAWTANSLYFEPARAADAQVLALQGELGELQVRERRLQGELSVTTPGNAVPAVAALADAAPSAAVSAERLQEIVRSAVAEFGGQAISSQSGVGELGGGYAKVSVLLRARFDEAGLLGFLRKLEGMTPVVLVEVLDVQPLPIPGEMRPVDVTASLVGVHADAAS